MNISLTTFIDFVMATPGSKVGVVREARELYEEGYKPERDFYKGFRDGVVAMHRNGSNRADLDQVVSRANQRKAEHYRACADGYKIWMGQKRFVALRAPSVVPWTSGPIEVSVNPELQVAVGRVTSCRQALFQGGEALQDSNQHDAVSTAPSRAR